MIQIDHVMSTDQNTFTFGGRHANLCGFRGSEFSSMGVVQHGQDFSIDFSHFKASRQKSLDIWFAAVQLGMHLMNFHHQIVFHISHLLTMSSIGQSTLEAIRGEFIQTKGIVISHFRLTLRDGKFVQSLGLQFHHGKMIQISVKCGGNAATTNPGFQVLHNGHTLLDVLSNTVVAEIDIGQGGKGGLHGPGMSRLQVGLGHSRLTGGHDGLSHGPDQLHEGILNAGRLGRFATNAHGGAGKMVARLFALPTEHVGGTDLCGRDGVGGQTTREGGEGSNHNAIIDMDIAHPLPDWSTGDGANCLASKHHGKYRGTCSSVDGDDSDRVPVMD